MDGGQIEAMKKISVQILRFPGSSFSGGRLRRPSSQFYPLATQTHFASYHRGLISLRMRHLIQLKMALRLSQESK